MKYTYEEVATAAPERLIAQLEQLRIEREEKKLEILANKVELTTIEEGIKDLEDQLEEENQLEKA